MKKVRIMQEGKSFEAYVQMLMLDGSTIIGLGIAGNITACRAIHASLYNAIGYSIIIEDEENDCRNHYRTSASFRRLEVLNGKVCHAFFLPRTAMQEDFETSLQRVEQNEEAVNKPDRIIIAKEDEIEIDIGQFLANVYGLPRSKEWADCYFTLLPRNKWEEIDIETTELMDDDFKDMRAIKLIGMLEREMLEFIEIGISSNVLSLTTDLESQAKFEENMTTEEYLRTNAESLAFHIDKHLKPRYDGLTLNREVGETKRVSLPAQARATMGILETLKHENSAFVVGDMGSGKSQISLTTVQSIMKQREQSGAKDGLRVLIVAPAITIPKWATSEIPTVLGAKHIKTIMLESTEDALKYVDKIKKGYKVKKGNIEFVLVSTDRMKLGASGY